jgi:hypothetical protein
MTVATALAWMSPPPLPRRRLPKPVGCIYSSATRGSRIVASNQTRHDHGWGAKSPIADQSGERPSLGWWRVMLLALVYSFLRLLLDILLDRRRSAADLQSEVLLLRHQVRVLQYQARRPRWQPGDRAESRRSSARAVRTRRNDLIEHCGEGGRVDGFAFADCDRASGLVVVAGGDDSFGVRDDGAVVQRMLTWFLAAKRAQMLPSSTKYGCLVRLTVSVTSGSTLWTRLRTSWQILRCHSGSASI